MLTVDLLARLAGYNPGLLPTVAFLAVCVGVLGWYWREDRPYRGFKLIGQESGDWSYQKARLRWNSDALDLLRDGFEQTNGKPFQVLSPFGPLVMLHPRMSEEIRNDKRFTFTGFIERLSSRLSAKILLGDRLARSKQWTALSISFASLMFSAGRDLRPWPVLLRPLVHRFLPSLNLLRSQIALAQELMEPELAAARSQTRKDADEKSKDSLSWIEEVRRGREFDVVAGQLFLTFAAIHTTSSILTALMYDLLANPEYFGQLREEIVRVFGEEKGWSKNSLYKLKLMDSCLKETARLHVLGPHMFNRKVEAPVTLSDGTHLPKGVHVSISMWQNRDPAIWGPDADNFDGHRFLRMREQPGQENRWQFVSTSPEWLAFGHGMHACPGRFFASNEMKIVMVHLIMNYDWKIIGEKLPGSMFKSRFVPDVKTVVGCKRREPEIQL
ncbi:cytochrome p450 [Colletotrichum camelliae]|nr:cytochrome p450 [Colletotrichum camelliae]